MKLIKSSLFLCAAALFALTGCDRSTDGKVKDGVNDALDRRPGENVRDAAEDTKDAVKEAGRDIKDAARDATR